MDWLLLIIAMTTEGGWTIHQTSFETKELCVTAQSLIQEQMKDDGDKFLRASCVQVQTDYGALRNKNK
jgi:hypothetical protein